MRIRPNKKKPWKAKRCTLVNLSEVWIDANQRPMTPYIANKSRRWKTRIIKGWEPCERAAKGTEHRNCRDCSSSAMFIRLGTNGRVRTCPDKRNMASGRCSWSVWRPIPLPREEMEQLDLPFQKSF